MLGNDAIAAVYKIASEDLGGQSVGNADNVRAHTWICDATHLLKSIMLLIVSKEKKGLKPLPTHNGKMNWNKSRLNYNLEK